MKNYRKYFIILILGCVLLTYSNVMDYFYGALLGAILISVINILFFIKLWRELNEK